MNLYTRMLKAEERRKAAEVSAPVVAPKPAKPKETTSEIPRATVPKEKRPRGRPHSGNETVTLRISSAVLDHYRATGKGWQSRLNADLRKVTGI